ncbi:hypothetical protein GH741_10715 [Aquibacillus halophilus]|uniref:PNPLA domain-containing protein n=1 Tax=Aquibacillus halophilus TaxID=930132 RepID=A0A6A8DHG6_9BACI|nr:patatin-like phospholipase family protein [Aquibacillus halophilus]MRH43151.1 hypothetical protein [Aquibacillus halophilus]
MRIDAVFSGGGVKAFAFIGALEKIEEHGYSYGKVVGTSAGAIIAGLLTAGYNAIEIKSMFNELELKKFMDTSDIGRYLPFIKWFTLYFTMGLYKGNAFEQWLFNKLAQVGVYTFKDIPVDSLRVIVSDLTLGRMVVIPDDLQELYGINPNDFSISEAIRMSAGFPFLFRPKAIKNMNYGKSLIVDGALLSNFPMWLFDQDGNTRTRPLLGIKLSDSIGRLPSNEIKNSLELFQAIFTTMRKAHDTRYVSEKYLNDVLFLPVKEVDATELELDKQQKDELIELGRNYTASFLKHWP